MDAKRFLEEWQRMCNAHLECNGCPTHWDGLNNHCLSARVVSMWDIDDLIAKVEQWAEEHPRKTRLDDFKEKYPNARVNWKGLPFIEPRLLGYCRVDDCRNCPHVKDWDIKDCWDAEVDSDE